MTSLHVVSEEVMLKDVELILSSESANYRNTKANFEPRLRDAEHYDGVTLVRGVRMELARGV